MQVLNKATDVATVISDADEKGAGKAIGEYAIKNVVGAAAGERGAAIYDLTGGVLPDSKASEGAAAPKPTEIGPGGYNPAYGGLPPPPAWFERGRPYNPGGN